MKLSDIKTIVKSVPIILAVTLYLIFKPSAEETIITPEEAVALTGSELRDATYVAVIEGDVVELEIEGKKQQVQLLAVDAPNMENRDGNPQPYATEATQFTTDLLKRAKRIQVLLATEPQHDADNGIGAYVFVDDVLLQERLVQEGYVAVRHVSEQNDSLEAKLSSIQDEAKKAKVNIWSTDDYVDAQTGFNESAIK